MGVPVRDHRNRVRDQSEQLSAIIGIRNDAREIPKMFKIYRGNDMQHMNVRPTSRWIKWSSGCLCSSLIFGIELLRYALGRALVIHLQIPIRPKLRL